VLGGKGYKDEQPPIPDFEILLSELSKFSQVLPHHFYLHRSTPRDFTKPLTASTPIFSDDTRDAMSSEFSSYFDEFLKDDFNEFTIFQDDYSIGESAGHSPGDDLQLQDRASSSFDPTISEHSEFPALTTDGANATAQVGWAPWSSDASSSQPLLPETDFGTSLNRQNGDESE